MDYEKAYKDALGVIRELHQAVSTSKDYLSKNSYLTEKFEQAFPELKESEDDKIRKGLIALIKECLMPPTLFRFGLNKEDTVAWLEKQGERKLNNITKA